MHWCSSCRKGNLRVALSLTLLFVFLRFFFYERLNIYCLFSDCISISKEYLNEDVNSWLPLVKISVTKLDDFYHKGFSDYCLHLYCYFHNVSADMSSGFFRCWSNSGTFTELQTTFFIESTGVACSDSISHNRVQALGISVLLLACSQDWTCNHLMIVSLDYWRVTI